MQTENTGNAMLALRQYTEESVMELASYETDFARKLARVWISTMTDDEVLEWNNIEDRSAYVG